MAKLKSADDFNLSDSCKQIERLVAKRTSVRAGMSRLIRFCARQFPHPAWEMLGAYDFDADVQRLRDWLVHLLKTEPPAAEIKVFWFGLFQPSVKGKTTCGLYVSGAKSFCTDEDPGDWDWKGRYWPEGRYANSDFLDLLYRQAYAKGGPGNMAEYTLGLGYAALAVVAIARSVEPSVLLGGASERTLAIGFDSGNALFAGIQRSDGLHAIEDAAHRKPVEPDDPQTQLYEIVQPMTGRWWIEEVLAADGAYLPHNFAQTGRSERVALPLTAKILDRQSKADVNFPLLGPPVVKQRIAEMLDELAPGAIQRLPVKVAGNPEHWEVLNVVAQVPWKEVLDAARLRGGTAWRTVLPGKKMFRVGGHLGPIAVDRDIKDQIERERVTGLAFRPLGR